MIDTAFERSCNVTLDLKRLRQLTLLLCRLYDKSITNTFPAGQFTARQTLNILPFVLECPVVPPLSGDLVPRSMRDNLVSWYVPIWRCLSRLVPMQLILPEQVS